MAGTIDVALLVRLPVLCRTILCPAWSLGLARGADNVQRRLYDTTKNVGASMMTRTQLWETALEIADGRVGNIIYKVTHKQGVGMTGTLVCLTLGSDSQMRNESVKHYFKPFHNRTLAIEEWAGVEEIMEDEDASTE